MTKRLTLIVATTALTAAFGLPAWSAMHTPAPALTPLSHLLAGDDARPLVLVDEDEDDDEEGGSLARRAASDDEDDDDDEDACHDDEGNCAGAAAMQAAPAGSAAPPQNGLFGTGTPQVKVK